MYPRRRKYGQSFDSERVVLGRLFSVHESETSAHTRRQRTGQTTVRGPRDRSPPWGEWT
jgi:hypothetical protein